MNKTLKKIKIIVMISIGSILKGMCTVGYTKVDEAMCCHVSAGVKTSISAS